MSKKQAIDRDIQDFLAALASPARQQILLCFIDGRERSVGELVAQSRAAQSTVSAHLTQLHRAGLLLRRKEGKEVYYRPDRNRISQLLVRLSSYLRQCC